MPRVQAVLRGFSQRQKFKKKGTYLTSLSFRFLGCLSPCLLFVLVKSSKTRKRIIDEILETERTYVKNLETMIKVNNTPNSFRKNLKLLALWLTFFEFHRNPFSQVFQEPLKASLDSESPLISPTDLGLLFNDLLSILPVNLKLLKDLEERLKTSENQNIGDIFLNMVRN